MGWWVPLFTPTHELLGINRPPENKWFVEGIKMESRDISNVKIYIWDYVCNANIKNIFVIKSILRCFELVLNLKVNFNKSKIWDIGVDNAYLYMSQPLVLTI